MKSTLHFIIALTSILFLNSCGNDDDFSKTSPNQVLIDGTYYDLNGSFIDDAHELQEDRTFKYAHELIIFGGGIKYTNLQEGYNGTGFILFAKMYSNTVDLDAGTYTLDPSTSPLSCQAGYSNNIDVDSESNPPLITIKSGSIKIERGSKDVVNFDVTDANGKRIKGTFDKPILGLYR